MSGDAVRAMNHLGVNETSLTWTRDPKSQNHIKHINVVHHEHVQALGDDVELAVDWIARPLMLASELRKVLLEKHRKEWRLGLYLGLIM